MARSPVQVPAPVEVAAALAWRFLVIAAAVAALVFALIRLRVVVLPVFVALLVTSLLVPLVTRLEERGARPGLATVVVFALVAVGLTGIVAVIAPAVGDEFDELGPAVSEGVDRIERWLVEGPMELSPSEIDAYRQRATEQGRQLLRSSSGGILAGALVVVEGVAGTLLAIVLSVFFVKDGRRFQRWVLDHTPLGRREVVRDLAGRAWGAIGGFLRGAALIGIVEAVVIGVVLAVVGASLALPVAILTFAAAFFPVVGAIAAGVIATLVALVSAGPSQALVVAVVALIVQQFDNDLLAPLVYGRLVHLHPAVVLLAITAGGTLGGIAGAFLAVPLAAVVASVGRGVWERSGEAWVAPDEVTPPWTP